MLTTLKQTQPSFWQELEAASLNPLAADLRQLWEQLEQIIKQSDELNRYQKLHLAGEAITQIFQIHVLRAKEILDALEVKDNSQGPILSEDFLDGLMRKSMTIDISDLMEDLFPKDQPSELKPLLDKSGASSIKAQKEAKGFIKSLAEPESVSEWKSAIAEWMQNYPAPEVSFLELQQGLGMPVVIVWLGLLQGGEFRLKQRGDFYDPQGICVVKNAGARNENTATKQL